jgi:hypothetical protein
MRLGRTHNVIYIVTQADSVYAIDADNGAQLWYASMLNGGTTLTTAAQEALTPTPIPASPATPER